MLPQVYHIVYFCTIFAAPFCTQVTLALKHMHARNMVHMDVKPDNIYVVDKTTYKLGDLGLATSSCSSYCGSFEEGDARYHEQMLQWLVYRCVLKHMLTATHTCALYQLSGHVAVQNTGIFLQRS